MKKRKIFYGRASTNKQELSAELQLNEVEEKFGSMSAVFFDKGISLISTPWRLAETEYIKKVGELITIWSIPGSQKPKITWEINSSLPLLMYIFSKGTLFQRDILFFKSTWNGSGYLFVLDLYGLSFASKRITFLFLLTYSSLADLYGFKSNKDFLANFLILKVIVL